MTKIKEMSFSEKITKAASNGKLEQLNLLIN